MAGALPTLRGVSDSVFAGFLAFCRPEGLVSLVLGGDTVRATDAGAVLDVDRTGGRAPALEASALFTTGMVGAGLDAGCGSLLLSATDFGATSTPLDSSGDASRRLFGGGE